MTGSHLLRSLLMICVLMSAEAGYANTRYVDSTAGNNTNTGTSWAAAYKTLAYAVNQAHSNTAIDTILVAKGTYYPEYMTGNGATNRDKAFTFTRSGLVVMGGYPSGGGLRNLSLYPTILSGALDASYHVVFVSGSTIDSTLKINGVQITSGTANGGGTISINGDIAGTFNGGGIFVHSGSPMFSDTKVFSNFADQFGGGIFSRGCPYFLNCTITGNSVSRNSSVGFGGGIYTGGSCMTIDRCELLSNSASVDGGGLYIAGSSQIMIANSIIKGNIANSGGGLFHNSNGASSITNVVVAGNAANSLGGGLYISRPISLTNVTVAGNATSANGAQLYTVSSPTFRNSIVWGNGVSSIVSSGGAPTYANCILDGSGGSTWNAAYGTNSGNNTNVNPLFMNYIAATTGNPAVNGDFRLSACSPATNRGNNSFYTSTDLRDAAGRPRIMGDTIDIGAYEVLKPTGRKIYVDSAIVTEGNGSSWVTATRSLAEAIRVANDGCVPVDSILVAKGTYYPEYQAGSTTGLRDKAFTITRNSLVILGGYPTGGGTHNATTNPTVMSGARDTNYHVLLTIGANIDTTLKLDGFTVTNGKANGGSGRITVNGFEWLFYNRGGGWYNGWGSPMLSNMIITSNASDDYGGGVLIEGNPIIRKMLITNNTSNRGGGWAQITGSTKADSLTISNNNATADGGGWYNNDGASTITNSIFNNNTASWGAGFYNTGNNPTISNAIIRSNTATTEGGGWFNYGGNPVVNNTTIAGNTGGRAAGWYNANGNPTVNNMLMTGNAATGNGGGWFNNGGSAIITNSTIAMNYGAAGRDLVTQNIAMTLQNSIIWSAANSTLTPQPWSGFQNCIVAGSGTSWNTAVGVNNGGNLDVNPLFVNAVAASAGNPVATGDYRLQSCSPAINKGRNSLASGISKDIAGRPRIIGDTVEIGAYEMIKPTSRKIYVDSAIATEGNGSSWATATRSLAEAIKVAHEGCVPVDSILVAKGTYYPEYLTGNGTTNRHKSFTFTRDSLVIIGGYASGGGVRNRTLYPTILSGARDTNVHVLMIAAGSIDSSLKFYGVDVTGGMAKEYSNLVVNGSSINSVLGGGICIIGSSPLFSDIKVLSNYADLMGGGVYSTGCPTFVNSLIAGNTSGFGGGIGSQGACMNISRCTITGNNANSDGGGVYNSNAVLNIKGSFVIGNRAQTGGGLTFHSSSSTSSSMTDVVVTGNTAGTGGGAEIAASIAITNTTFAGNFSGNGSQLYITSSPVLKNSIVWGSGTSSINRQSGSPTYTNCILDGSGTSTWNTAYGSDGGNNSSANPLFVNYVTATSGNPNVNGDFRLTTCSPAINRGDNSFNTNLTDIAGRPRIMGDTIDIGAYETVKPTGHKIYVDSAATTNGNGDSWATATRSLAEAVKLAHESCTGIDTILVAKGTYNPEYMAGNGTTNRDKSFTFTRDSLVVMGGYTSGGGVRDPNIYPTILSGAVDQNYHVMVIAGGNIDSSLKFIGLDITGGRADFSSSISVNSNTIYNSDGGGIYLSSGSPVFLHLKVYANQSVAWGGGIYSGGCPKLLKSVVTGNTAGDRGGGIHCESGCMNINECTISSNTATQSFGGGLSSITARVNIANTTIKGNASGNLGGGIYLTNSSAPGSTMDNIVVSGNVSDQGGGLYIISSSVSVINSTIVGNGRFGARQVYINDSSPKFKNSIIWGGGSGSIQRSGAAPSYSNCIIDGSGGSTAWNTSYGVDSGNNRAGDPIFVNLVSAGFSEPTTNGDYRLSACSPAINSGNNTFYTNTQLTDIAGRPRIMGDTIDIGAYETAKPTGHKIYVDSAATINGNGDSWATATRSLAEAVKLAHESCTAIDTILVAKGTYYPEYMAGNGTTNRTKSFTFTRDSLAVIGGYASGGGVRDRNLYPTILSGALDQNYHVMMIAGSNIDSTLRFYGVDITGGRADMGGATVLNGTTIYSEQGGGIYIASGSPVFSDIKIALNYAQSGGGVFSNGCPTFLSSLITRNSTAATSGGGGIYTNGGCMTVNNCTISLNRTDDMGGGWYNRGAQIHIANTVISGNLGWAGAGGLYHVNAAPGSTMTNVLVTGNDAGARTAGGLFILSSLSLTNVTIAGNSAFGDIGQVRVLTAPVDFKNCIVWGSGTSSLRAVSTATFTNCIIDGSGGSASWNASYGTDGGNNRDINPMFVNFVSAGFDSPTTNGDFRLSACSPAINRGNNTFYTNTQLTDIAGRPRIMGDTIDIGAYETAKPTGHKIYVDSAATISGNGDSWATATRSLAEAVKMAHESCTAVDTILVAKGTYNPEYMAGNGTTNKDKSFTFTRDSLVVMGSYASGGGVHDRNLYPTILSGAVDSNYHVMVIAGSNIDSSLKFYGIDITGGRANNFLSSISVNGNLIASNNGGGIHIAAGSPVFSDVKVALNTSTGHGAGIYSMGCPTLFNSVIAHNVVADKIGLIGNGGGIYSVIGCMNVNNCTISSNSVDLGTGGGWHNLTARINVVNTIISDNTARFEGGGLYNYSADAGSSMHNVLITGNNAGPMGGGLYINSPLSLTNVTIAGNSTSSFARQVYIGATSEFKNCIVWGSGGTSIFRGNGSPTYANCILEGTGGSTAWNTNYGVDGGNNKNTDPLFVNPGTRDYRLQFCSPAINAGDNNAIGALATDLAGNPRIIGTTADIGAYEKQSTTTAGSFGNNVALSNARGNASPLLGTSCEDGGWTYYATPNNPDSLSFAIQWGAANATAKAAAQVRLMLDTNNTLAAAGNAATTTMKRYWNVDLNGSTLAAPVSVRFFYNPADTIAMRSALAGQSTGTPGSLRWFKTNSGAFNPSMVSASDVNGGAITLLTPVYGTANNTAYAEFGTINSFSGGTASMAISATPLPVQLIDFTAARTKPGQVQLNWRVANEQLQRYIIMRSHNAIDFQPIGTVQAAGKTAYSLTDMIAESSFANSTIYYRLSLEEYGGTTGYSKVVRINIGNIHSPISVSPNPVQNVFTISQVEGALIGEPVTITDATGKLIAQHVLEEGLKVDASQWTSGVYFLRLPGGVTLKMVKL